MGSISVFHRLDGTLIPSSVRSVPIAPVGSSQKSRNSVTLAMVRGVSDRFLPRLDWNEAMHQRHLPLTRSRAIVLLCGLLLGCNGDDSSSADASASEASTAASGTGDGSTGSTGGSTASTDSTVGADSTTGTSESASSDETSMGTTVASTSTTSGTTSSPADPCSAACEHIESCGGDLDYCMEVCEEDHEYVAGLDVNIFPGCVDLVDDIYSCYSRADCDDPSVCEEMEDNYLNVCFCGSNFEGSEQGCWYDEQCGAVSHEVKCSEGSCVCTINGEEMGSCELQVEVCDSGDIDTTKASAAECCGWEPLDF